MKLIECPRDAMQGIAAFIPTEIKAKYINSLLEVGFDSIDFGSFVSPKATPQMRDTAAVLEKLQLDGSHSKLLAIVANRRGAEQALAFPEISYLGFPLSVSETFQQRNTRKSIAEAFEVVFQIQELCTQHHKTLIVYLSMAFGNPYGEPLDENVLAEFTEKLRAMGIEIILLSDTIGVSTPATITTAFQTLIPAFASLEIGAHFHSNPNTALEKVAAAYQAGCRRFDGALKGYGGCPMAKDELTGNIATEKMLQYFQSQNISIDLNMSKLAESLEISKEVFLAQA